MQIKWIGVWTALTLLSLISGCTVETAWDKPSSSQQSAKPPVASKETPNTPHASQTNLDSSATATAEVQSEKSDKPNSTPPATNTPKNEQEATKQPTMTPKHTELTTIPTLVGDKDKVLSWYYLKKGEGIVPGFPSETKEYGPDRKAIYVGAGHKVYLTFDNGGPMGDTSKLLKTLKDNGVKANFFLAGYNMREHKDFLKQLVADGHLIANHTMTHKDMTGQTDAEVRTEIEDYERMYTDITGESIVKFFRFPYGKYSMHLLELLTEMGYTSVFWSTAMRDWEPRKNGPDDAYNDVMNGLHDGNIILLHQGSEDNIKALDRIIKGIREQGYEFGLLTDF